MNLSKALALGRTKLAHLENPNLEAEVLLLSCLLDGYKGRTFLRTNPSKKLGVVDQLLFRWRLYQRQRNIPTAYILKHAQWNGLDLYVDRFVLIPRDETETLCHHIFESLSPYWGELEGSETKKILDIGTGSGCLAIWLKQRFPEAVTTALDISWKALQIARYNAAVNHTNISFKRSNLLSNISDQSHFDLIVANLPYVPSDMVVTTEVDQEPRTAIFSGQGGLAHISRLAVEIKQKNITFDQLWLEFLPSQQKDIQTLFSDYEVKFFPAVNGEIFFACIKSR